MRTRTSATRSDGRLAGFTLVELLVVFAILSLLVVVVPIAYERLRESSQYREALRNVITDLKTARHRAQTESREVRFVVDHAKRIYGVEGQALHVLPETLQMRTTVASIEMDPAQVASIRFLPSGGATGGALDVLRPSGNGARLAVDWFSGQVSQSPIEP